MTVSRTTSRWEYLGDGVTTAFPFDNLIFAASDLQVYVDSERLTSGYSVTGVGVPSGGAVLLTAPPATGAAVVLVRETPATQERAYPPNDPFPASEHERALDKLTVLVQQLDARVSRAVLVPPGQAGAPVMLLPPDRAGRLLGCDDGGNLIASAVSMEEFEQAVQEIQGADVDAIVSDARGWASAAEGALVTDSDGNAGYSAYHWAKRAERYIAPNLAQGVAHDAYIADGVTVEYPLGFSLTAAAVGGVLVTIDGILQHLTAYTIADGRLVFTEPPTAGTAIQVLYIGLLAVSTTVAQDAAQTATAAVATVSGHAAAAAQSATTAGEAAQAADQARIAAEEAAASVSYDAAAVAITGGSISGVTLAATSITLGGAPLATVATSGAYTDLSGRPSLTAVATSGSINDLTGTTFNGGLTVTGDLVVQGATVTVNATTVEVADNLLLLNKNEAGAGVTAGTAGIEIERGTTTNYQFLFDESDDSFKIGMAGDLQPVATREGAPVAGGIATWDDTAKRFKTGAEVRGQRPLGTDVTASRTLALTDANAYLVSTAASAVTLTVPPNGTVAFPVGTEIDVFAEGAGQVTIAAGAGVTIRSKGGALKVSGQYSGATLKKRAADTWHLVGDLSA